jgi:hypothetical protein
MEKAKQILIMSEVANVGNGNEGIYRARGYKARNVVKTDTPEKK